MSKPFDGVVNVDIRDSTPDWEPFLQPQAPESAPNVLMIVCDDVGYGAMDVEAVEAATALGSGNTSQTSAQETP
jgi:hypothetical protein